MRSFLAAFGVLVSVQSVAVDALAAASELRLVRDINQQADPLVSSSPGPFVRAGALVFFTAYERKHGRELWVTDGSPAGTRMVTDFTPGPASTFDRWFELAAFGDAVVFSAEGDDGAFLGVSDGTAIGTAKILEGRAKRLTLSGNRLFFLRDSAIWVTDATAQGTREAFDFHGYGSWLDWPEALHPGAGGVFFYSDIEDEVSGLELWFTDGTRAGTTLVKDIRPGRASSLGPGMREPRVAEVDGGVVFVADDGVSGPELWFSDGTPAGTERLLDLRPGPEGAFPRDRLDHSNDPDFVDVGGAVLFLASDDGLHLALWRTDGSPAGTAKLMDLPLSSGEADCGEGFDSCRPGMWKSSGTIWINIEDPIVGELYWQTDGTVGGTRFVGSEFPEQPAFARVEPAFAFAGGYDDGLGVEPWWTDGTPAGTFLLRDIFAPSAGSFPRHPIDLNGILLFTADDGFHGRELWRSDGSNRGTYMVADIAAGSAASSPDELVRVGDLVYFTAEDEAGGRELWATDGTSAGTRRAADIHSGTASSSPKQLTPAGDRLFFFAEDGQHGVELWQFHPGEGASLVADIHRGEQSGGLVCRTIFSETLNSLLFFADDGVNGAELWRTDGTTGGTIRLTTRDSAQDWCGGPFIEFDSRVYFGFDDDDHGWRIWATDGTEEGTVPFFDSEEGPGYVSSSFGTPRSIGDRMFFAAAQQLWISDGTAEGTRKVTEPRRLSRNGGFAVASGQMFFIDDWRNIWRADGLHRPVRLPSALRPTRIAATAGRILFTNDETYPKEQETLWTTDGSERGMHRIGEITRDEDRGSTYSSFLYEQIWVVAAGDHIFLNLDTDGFGSELWAVPLDSVPEACANGCPPPSTYTPTPSSTATPTATPTPTPRCHPHSVLRECSAVEVSSANAYPGDLVEVVMSLRSEAMPIVALQFDLVLPADIEIERTATGRPDCRVNPAIDKPGSRFDFVDADGKRLRTLFLSFSELTAIANGSQLLNCRLRLSDAAAPGALSIGVNKVIASDFAGQRIPMSTKSGMIEVSAETTPTNTATPSSTFVAAPLVTATPTFTFPVPAVHTPTAIRDDRAEQATRQGISKDGAGTAGCQTTSAPSNRFAGIVFALGGVAWWLTRRRNLPGPMRRNDVTRER